jgi:predicted dinucleotide-binding enzyme
MPCIEQLVGPEAYFAALALAVGVLVNGAKRIPKISSNAVPVFAFVLGYVIDAVLGHYSCGLTLAEAALSGLGGGLAGLAAAGGHEALMRSANAVGLGKAATLLLGKAKSEQVKRKTKTRKTTTAAIVLLALMLTGCAGVLEALAKAGQGAQWIGTVVDVAEAGADAYFDRHPNLEASRRVEAAVRRARSALAALDAALATADAVEREDVAQAKLEAVRAYAELRGLLAELGVLTATPPAGGAEGDAPAPEPVELPLPEAIKAAL